jgi:hypothetical protein
LKTLEGQHQAWRNSTRKQTVNDPIGIENGGEQLFLFADCKLSFRRKRRVKTDVLKAEFVTATKQVGAMTLTRTPFAGHS